MLKQGKAFDAMKWYQALVLMAFATLTLGGQGAGLDSATPLDPFLNGALPSISPGAAPDAEWTQVDYYPDLTFVEPIRIIEHPTQDRLLIVGKDGIGWTVSHQLGATDRQLFFNIQPIMQGKSGVGEGGISDLVFHPEFGQSGSPSANFVYITYRWSPTGAGTFENSPSVDGYNRLSRFTVVNGQVDLSTELLMINQYDRQQWHIGGDMFFGDDGYLYISAGDEGNCCDRNFTTQRLDAGLWSGILRIDVDQDASRSHPIRRQPTHLQEDPTQNGPGWPPSSSQNYFIPNDNPFLDASGGQLEEFFSIGLRHPFTISRDPETGNIWIADVGEVTREEINISRIGDNHQWGYREGNANGVIPVPSETIGNPAPPVWDYPRNLGQAVIGAGVYRGDQFPELFGKYLFSDFVSGRLWTATENGGGHTIEQIGSVSAGFPDGINSYLLDSKGNILLARTAGGLNSNGRINMLVRSADANIANEPPLLLSQTNAFTNLSDLSVNPGCIPYDLNTPFWSDNALKSRWMCIPNDGQHNTAAEQIEFSADGVWRLPVGGVLIKHFELQTDSANPNARVRLETRLIVQGETGHYGVTYRWNDDGTDAELLSGADQRTLTVTTPQGSRQQTWEFPSRGQCLTCHSTALGAGLGTNTRQLNRDQFYPSTGRTSNQIETLNSLGMLSPAIPAGQLNSFLASVTTSTPTTDANASLTDRARSYLDANCAYCHRPNGVRANFDARLTTPLADQGLINGELAESFGIAGEAVVVPGDLSRSVLFHRADSAGESFSMPPIAKNLVDESGVSLLAEWIESLGGFQLGNDTSVGGSFIDNHHPSLYINESDTFIQGAEAGTLRLGQFSFFAQRLGNPVTPFVVRVLDDNMFTVLAIGTTRTQQSYAVGENRFPFSDQGEVVLSLAPGDQIAVGFMDSFADGTGWGAGTVIPAEAGSGSDQDEIWALLPNPLISQTNSFQASRDTAAIATNEAPTITNLGKALRELTNLRRSYKFAIGFASADSPADSSAPGAGVPQFQNGSFEAPTVSNFALFNGANDIPGWTITSGQVEIDRTPWPAADGQQSMDLAGAVSGALEQTVSGFQPGARYALTFSYGLHRSAQSARQVAVSLDQTLVQTYTANTAALVPNYQTAVLEFTAPADGQVTFGFENMGPDSRGVVIDGLRLVLIAAGNPSVPPPVPTPPPTPAPSPTPGPDPTPTPGGSCSFQSSSSGSFLLSIEAENFTDNVPRSGDAWEIPGNPVQGFSGVAALQALPDNRDNISVNYATTSPELSVAANFTSVGTHYVFVRGHAENGGSNSLHFGLDGQEVPTAERINIPRSAGYEWTDGSHTINVNSPGVHSLQIWMREDGTYVDKILVTTDPNFVPTSVGPAESICSDSSGGGNQPPAPAPDPVPTPAPSPIPGGSCSFEPASSGPFLLSIEAENFTDNIPRSGDAWEIPGNPVQGFSGVAALQALPDNRDNISVNYATTSPELSVAANFTSVGTHYVFVRGHAENGGSNSLHFGLDGQQVPTAERINIPRSAGYEWTDGSHTIDVSSPGVHSLQIWMREDGTYVDKILVTTDPNFIPTSVGPAESTCSGSGGGGSQPPAPAPDPAPDPAPTPSPTPVLLPVVVNGGFESTAVPNNRFNIVNALSGWTPDTTAEIWNSGFLGQNASEGARFSELDVSASAVDGMVQDLITTAGQDYVVLFDVKQRAGFSAQSNQVEVRWNGASVGRFTPASNQWETIEVVVTGSGDDRLGFYETNAANDGGGSHLDNVSIELRGGDSNVPVQSGQCNSSSPNLLTNGSFELTSNPNFASARALIEALGSTNNSGRFLDSHPDSDFPGWFTTGGIALQQGGFSQGGTIEAGTNGFLGLQAPDGNVFVEMDGNHHNQLVDVTPGQILNWRFSHRGRPGTDTVSLYIGPADAQSLIDTVSSPNTQWVTHTGQYVVPQDVDEVLFTITPLLAANGDIDSSNLLDDVSLCIAN